MCALMAHFTVIVTHAGWVDDWITQHTETSPGYFEGQKRGYYTAGSFSGRWQTGNDYLWTVMPPKLKSGCGGIDIFMGGFSFLDFDYLVTKLQNILQAAPAAAFDIALKTLCEQCANTVKDLEAVASQLNQIQIDDCKASRALVATVAKPFFQDKETELSVIQSDFMQSTGIEDLFHKIKEDTRANDDNPIVDLKQAMQGCPQDVRDVFGTSGSVIDSIAVKIGFSDLSYRDLIRGLIGDIVIQEFTDSYEVAYIPPCDENKEFSIEDFLNGAAFARSSGSSCYQITDANRDLVMWVQNRMQNIADSYRNRTALTPDDEQFIDANPLPLALIIRTAVGTQQEPALLATLSDVTAKAYAYRMFYDLYNKAFHILEKGKSLISAQSNAVSGLPAHQCRLTMVEDAVHQIPEMQMKLFEMMKGIRASYAASAGEVSSILSIVDKLKTFDELAREKLVDQLGPAVAERVMQGR